MPEGLPPDGLQPREALLWRREAARWACLPRSLRGVSHDVYGKLPGGSLTIPPIAPHASGKSADDSSAARGMEANLYAQPMAAQARKRSSAGRRRWCGQLIDRALGGLSPFPVSPREQRLQGLVQARIEVINPCVGAADGQEQADKRRATYGEQDHCRNNDPPMYMATARVVEDP